MAQLRKILDLEFAHDFFPESTCTILEIEPDDGTSALSSRHQLAIRHRTGGFGIHVLSEAAFDTPVPIRLVGWSRDPSFELYTDLSIAGPAGCLSFSDTRIQDDGRTLEAAPASETLPRRARPARITLEATLDPSVPCRSLRIRLAARPVFWKYHLFGEFATRPLRIVDTTPGEAPLAFRKTESVAIEGASTWASEIPIPARLASERKIQLRDTETGRVLVKRLPNPDFRTIGREPLSTGGTALALEAFIHP